MWSVPRFRAMAFLRNQRKPVGGGAHRRCMGHADAAPGYSRYFAQGGDWGSAVTTANWVAKLGSVRGYTHQYAQCGSAERCAGESR